MFTFKSPANPKNIWKLCFRPSEELTDIYYNDKKGDDNVRFFGVTDYATSTVYIDKNLDGFPLIKTLRHELAHIYLWETGQQDRSSYTEEDICDIISTAGPDICKLADNIVLRLKEGLYKKGE